MPQVAANTENLTIYIEGDGLSWVNITSPSSDPTPLNPMALKLALNDPAPSVYLARPCQYTRKKDLHCSQQYWTNKRFSAEIIEATNQAIDQIKRQLNAKNLILVGYSGGGAVAALIAAQRHDIKHLFTIAGNLDHVYWTSMLHLSPLSGSLNPRDFQEQLQHIPQTHFVGAKDNVINESVVRSYTSYFPTDKKPTVIVVPEFDHQCCWVINWNALKQAYDQ